MVTIRISRGGDRRRGERGKVRKMG